MNESVSDGYTHASRTGVIKTAPLTVEGKKATVRDDPQTFVRVITLDGLRSTRRDCFETF